MADWSKSNTGVNMYQQIFSHRMKEWSCVWVMTILIVMSVAAVFFRVDYFGHSVLLAPLADFASVIVIFFVMP